MKFIYEFSSGINRIVLKASIPLKTMQKLKISKGKAHEKDHALSLSTDAKTSKNRLEVQIMKNAGGRIRTCEGTKPIAFTTINCGKMCLRLSPLTAREPPRYENEF